MYDFSNILRITKEDVLNKISEYDIYVKYLAFRPVVGELYLSPLRPDNNPSFGIFKSKKSGNLLFKDLGTGDCGDCFKLASLIEHKSISEICKELYKGNETHTPKEQLIPIKESRDLDIVVDDILFTEEGLKYWNDFGISLDTLNLFHVKQIRRFWVNGKEYWSATKSKPMFSYFVYDKTKIYRPFFKKLRFYGNVTGTSIQGWEQMLQKIFDGNASDTIFITKSMKDVMLLHELGYIAIAPNGEGHNIPDNAINYLKSHFKHIIILYDRDMPGMKAAHKLWLKNKDFDFMFIPRHTQKDLSDYYKANGKEITIKLLSNYEQRIRHLSPNDNTNN